MNSPYYLEREVLIHRYLYYVEACPILPDCEYDKIERKAREVCPPESKVHGIGSSLPSSYPEDVKLEALRRLP